MPPRFAVALLQPLRLQLLRLSNLLLLLALASFPAHADAFFARLPEPAARDPFPWNTLIRAHATGNPRKALLYFTRIRQCGVAPDAYTFPAALKACGCASGCRVGFLVHAEAVRRGMDGDLSTSNAPISFYCRIRNAVPGGRCSMKRVAAAGPRLLELANYGTKFSE